MEIRVLWKFAYIWRVDSGAVSGRYSTFNGPKSALSLPQIEGARGADTYRKNDVASVCVCLPAYTMFNIPTIDLLKIKGSSVTTVLKFAYSDH